MYKTTFVMCDFGLLPGYLTLVLYFIVLILIHVFVINPIANDKNKIVTKISKFIFKHWNKSKHKKMQKMLPIVIITIVFLLMFLLYPVITNKYCPHKFWNIFGINTL